MATSLLTQQDVDTIRTSWAPISANPERSGLSLLKLFFKRYPNYLGLFGEFTDLDLNQIEADRRVARHAIRVIGAIDKLVGNLNRDQPENNSQRLHVQLKQLVDSHVSKRGIGHEKFEHLGTTLVDYLVGETNDKLIANNLLVDAWTKLYAIILSAVQQAEDKIRQQNC